MKKSIFYLFIGIIFLNAPVIFAQTVKDIDGKIYKTVKVNTQQWITENLDVSRFLNGDSIPQAKTAEEWINAGKEGKPAWCYYKNDIENGHKYGKLYNWYAVIDPRRLAPKGWHIPSSSEWISLIKFLGNVDVAGAKLKSTTGWHIKGTDKSGFSGLPGGHRLEKGGFSDINEKGHWWSATESFGDLSQVHSLSVIDSSIEAFFIKVAKDFGLSVRCVKD